MYEPFYLTTHLWIDRRFTDSGNNIAAVVTLIKYDSLKAVDLKISMGNSNITEHMKDLEKQFGVMTSGIGDSDHSRRWLSNPFLSAAVFSPSAELNYF